MKHRLICLHNGAPHAIADEKQEDPLVLRNFIQGHLASRLMSRGDLRFPIWFFWLYDDPKELEKAKRSFSVPMAEMQTTIEDIADRENYSLGQGKLRTTWDLGKNRTRSLCFLIFRSR